MTTASEWEAPAASTDRCAAFGAARREGDRATTTALDPSATREPVDGERAKARRFIRYDVTAARFR